MVRTCTSLNRRTFLKTGGMGSAALLWGCQPGIRDKPSGRHRFAAPGKGRPNSQEEVKLDPDLPNVLIIGDSISLGYTPHARRALIGKANIVHAPGNNQGTTLGRQKLTEWLGDMDWDIIHFNWGLHDLKHVNPDTGKNFNDPSDPQQADIRQYRENMQVLVDQLRQTGAELIFATTMPYPAGVRPCRIPEDAPRYNEAAQRIMKKYGIAINDLYSFALPRLEELQNPVNVHFSPKGSEALAREVAKAIEGKLEVLAGAESD